MLLDRSLDLMVFKGNRAPSSDDMMLPSWVPNWPILWAGGMTYQERSFQKWRIRYNYNPLAGKTQPENMVKLTGARLDRIRSMTTKMDSNENVLATKPPVRSWIYQFEDDISSGTKRTGRKRLRSGRREALLALCRTLTMDAAGQTSAMTSENSTSLEYVFSLLWTPSGRGIIANIDLIQWIDQNVHFRIEGVILREWSQVPLLFPYPLRPEQESGNALDSLIESLEGVLGSGMKLACVDMACPNDDDKEIPIMVHPNAEVGDCIFLLKGCSVLVVMRLIDSKEHSLDPSERRWHIIGGAYADDAVHPAMNLLHHWKEGSDPPRELSTILTHVVIC